MSAARGKIIVVAGARPNFMKIAPLMEVLRGRDDVESILVHTGQHYDRAMSETFFEELGIPRPDVHLGVGPGSQAEQLAAILQKFAAVLVQEKPDVVVVVGDVTSTLACALAAVKSDVAVAHVEAGLRSFDRGMPEEINRIVTDAVSDLLFVTEPSGIENLVREGVAPERIHFSGNVMIDTLLRHRAQAETLPVARNLGLEGQRYALVTLHRPSNVDDPESLRRMLEGIRSVSAKVPVLFPCHPRTRVRIEALGIADWFSEASAAGAPAMRWCQPFGYLEFLKLMSGAALMLTDSGGVQEETTVLGVPCITLRENTERPVTITEGTNVLVGADFEKVHAVVDQVLGGSFHRPRGAPRLWDGKAAQRIVDVLVEFLPKRKARRAK